MKNSAVEESAHAVLRDYDNDTIEQVIKELVAGVSSTPQADIRKELYRLLSEKKRTEEMEQRGILYHVGTLYTRLTPITSAPGKSPL